MNVSNQSDSPISGNPVHLASYDDLTELALNVRWSWHHGTDEIWQQMNPELWEDTQNPWAVLQTTSRRHLQEMLANPDFRGKVDGHLRSQQEAHNASSWFEQTHSGNLLSAIAYFSMEFMLSEGLPIYSGGLGNVAGDQLKAASDLGVPVIGIGLLYQQGYFRQVIDRNGAQQALYPYNDPGQLPITPLRTSGGEWLRLEMTLLGQPIWLRAWQVQVGRVMLYLLDSNDPANLPQHRGITSELYGGDSEMRLQQELLLGIGGWRLLEALGIQPEVCHLNEGHAAFAVLERARSFMQTASLSFEAALTATRAGNLFTTHTAVAAGFDRFSPGLIAQYLGTYASELGISLSDLMALGRQNPSDPYEDFHMAYLAIRGSGAVNGVSQLHGKVSRQLFTPLFPRWPVAEIPVGSVTNGVHCSTWDSAVADALWTGACGQDRWLGTMETIEQDIRRIPDTDLWQMRTTARESFVAYARQRLSRQLAASGASLETVDEANHLLNPQILTLGFARRFAGYKRPNLLLHDPERLLRLLTNTERPVQLIIAGKAHPADQPGQALIQQWISFIRRSEARPHVIFLSDYDMFLAGHLVQGVDVWINTPQRPWEACGTSGMKVLVNGGLNLSELDGWWAEAFTPEVGWALGDGKEHGDDPAWDAAEANALYDLLEQQVIPEFYQRDENSIPTAWVTRMRESMARLTPQFSANRAVREYTEKYYLPAATSSQARTSDNGAIGTQIVDWRQQLEQEWASIQFQDVKAETRDNQHLFEVQLCLGDLDPKMVQVELYAEGIMDNAPIRQTLEIAHPLADSPGCYVYSTSVSASRPATDYTARVIPHYEGVKVPLEFNLILWQQ